MGGAQSTRSISVENKQPTTSGPTMQVSEAAIRRALLPDQPAAAALPIQESGRVPPHQHPFKQHYDYSGDEQYWKQRIDSLKQAHRSIKAKMDEEYNNSMAETTQMFQRAQTSTHIGKLPPCLPERTAVVNCYNANPTQPLLCAEFVNTFSNCVSNKRCNNTANGA